MLVLSVAHRNLTVLLAVCHCEMLGLDIPQQISCKLGVMMYGTQHGKAPQYLVDYCTTVSDVPVRQRLQSAIRHQLVVPRHRLSTYGWWAIFAGPSVWNSLPVELQDPDISIGSFK